MSVSTDGFVAALDQELDWFTDLDEAAEQWTLDAVWNASAHMMGRRTYYDMASYWPLSTHVFASPMNEIPKIVATKGRLEETPVITESWLHPTIVHNLNSDVEKLKREDGKPIVAHGGAAFAQNLVASGLIDEFQLLVHPVAIGNGMPLFSRLAQPLQLDLVYAKPFSCGAVAHVYRPKK